MCYIKKKNLLDIIVFFFNQIKIKEKLNRICTKMFKTYKSFITYLKARWLVQQDLTSKQTNFDFIYLSIENSTCECCKISI